MFTATDATRTRAFFRAALALPWVHGPDGDWVLTQAPTLPGSTPPPPRVARPATAGARAPCT